MENGEICDKCTSKVRYFLSADAEQLNDFFAALGPNTVKPFANDPGKPHLANVKRVSNSFILSTVSESEVLSAGLSLANKRSCGYDDLSPLMLKRILPALLTPLTHVYNTTFLTGIVPKQFKIAKVVPVFKSGDPSLPVNYRPISLLSSFSKILEKLMYNKMISFINKYDILSNCQFVSVQIMVLRMCFITCHIMFLVIWIVV